MTNQHLHELARELDVRLILDPEYPPHASATQTVEHVPTGMMFIRVFGQGSETKEGYYSVLHELGHADSNRRFGFPDKDPEYEQALIRAVEEGGERPMVPGFILKEEAYATRWALAHAEPGAVPPYDYLWEALDSYYVRATEEALLSEDATDFLALYEELGRKSLRRDYE